MGSLCGLVCGAIVVALALPALGQRRVELDHVGAFNWRVAVDSITIQSQGLNTTKKTNEVPIEALLESVDVSTADGGVSVDNPIFQATSTTHVNALAERGGGDAASLLREFSFVISSPSVFAEGDVLVREMLLSEASVVMSDGVKLTAVEPFNVRQEFGPVSGGGRSGFDSRFDFEIVSPVRFVNASDQRVGELSGVFSLVVVPAPGSSLLLGAAGLLAARRR